MKALVLAGLVMVAGAGAAEAQQYGHGHGGYHSSYSDRSHPYARGDDRRRGHWNDHPYQDHGWRDRGPPPPAEVTWGAPGWGQPYAAGRPYGHASPYVQHGHPGYGHGYGHSDWSHDRGGRYGWSYSGVREPRPAPGYRDDWGYNNDQHPTGYRYRYGDVRRHTHGEGRSCDCPGPYLYDR